METRLRHSFGLGEITVFHTKILNCCAISKKNIMELFINQNADEFKCYRTELSSLAS